MINQFSLNTEIANDAGNPIPVGTSATPITGSYTFGATTLSLSGIAGAFTVAVNTITGIGVGATVSGTGIGSGATVTAINTSTGVLTLSVPNSGFVSGTLSFTMASGAVLATGSTNVARVIGVHLSSLGTTGALQVQVSNDGTNWGTIVATTVSSGTGALSNSMTSTALYRANLAGFSFWRLLQGTAITAGTTTWAISLTDGATDSAQNQVILNANAIIGYSLTSTYYNISAGAGVAVSTTSVSTSARSIGCIVISNQHNTVAYLKIFDSASVLTSTAASPPIFGSNAKYIAMCPAGQTVVIPFPVGLRLTSGFQIFVGANNSQNDGTTINTANVVTVQVAYA